MKRTPTGFRRLMIEALETRRTLSASPFALVALPDTQFYTQSYPATYDAQTQWIVDNIGPRNIAFVSQLGDIVQSGESGTNQNELQWTRADSAVDLLDGNLATQLDGLVPYSFALGNHDYAVVSDKTSGSTRYQQFFGPSRYEGRSWYLEDSGLRGAHAQIFEVSGYRFLHLAVQFEALDADLAWAQGVIDRNPGLPTILSMHSYLNPSTQARQTAIQGNASGVPNIGNTGEQVFQKLVYNNPSVFLVLNGHFTGEFTQISTNQAGQPVVEMVTDYQGLQLGGDGWMRVIDFNIPLNRLDFTTYSPTRDEFQTDADSLFSIPFDFVERFGIPEDMSHNVTQFQNGRVNSNAIYNGVVDTQIRQNAPTTSYGSSTAEVLVDFPDTGSNNASHALLKFSGIFGNGAGQLPVGSQIIHAKLVLDSINPGAGAKFHRMLMPWDGSTTWNSWSNDGVQANDIEATSTYHVQIGNAALTPLVPVESELTVDVTTDVRSWASGTANHGWAFLPWTNGTNGWAFSPSDVASFGDHPLLEIEWLPPTGANIPPSIASTGAAVTYTENALPIALFPTAVLSDTDSLNFDGGSIRVDIVSNASNEDRLIVRHDGNASGQVGVAADIVSLGGIPIGQVSDGVGAKSLSISFNSQASRAAVETVLRNLAFSNGSEAPVAAVRSLRLFVRDGDGGLSNQIDKTVNIIAINDVPIMTTSTTGFFYSSVGDVHGLDTMIQFSDFDSLDLNGGTVTVQFSANVLAGDVLRIRNQGNGTGQIGLSGNAVSFQGTVMGTSSGGTNGLPLIINLNVASNATNIQALLRALTFQTSNDRLNPATRTIAIVVTDGDGGTSNTASLTVDRSMVRHARFQEGVDSGQGIYAGASDIQLRESNPTTAYPTGSSATDGLFIDYDPTAINSQVLLRFDNIFGNVPGLVAPGATIVAARLILDVNNPGDGASFHRMLTAWDAQLETWTSFGNAVAPRNNQGGVQTDGNEARVDYRAQGGTIFGTGDVAVGPTVIGVTNDIQAWSNGETNLGWLIRAWAGFMDGWAFSPSEAAQLTDRPRLEIEWIPSTTSQSSFQQGVNGYLGTVDTILLQDSPNSNQSASGVLFVDDNSPDALNPGQFLNDQSQVLLRFDNIVGQLANQVSSGAWIHAAIVDLASNTSNAPGVGGRFFAIRQSWSATSNWNSLVNGVQADGNEAAANPSVLAGNQPTAPRIEGGFNSWEVTNDVQAWTSNAASNLGWALLPWPGKTDGWGIQSSETSLAHERPQLRVFFTPVGITVNPINGLTTTELGGTAQFSIALNTPPTDNVTIQLTSSNSKEGLLSTSSVIFGPSNWDVPQLVTVTGVDDLIANGDMAYQIISSSAVSLDSNYNGLNANDVSLMNTGNGLSVPIVLDRQVFYHRSTSSVFGDGSGNPTNAIDPTKEALLPGQPASFNHVTNYVRGINGLVVDLANLIGAPSVADFQFATWNGIDVAGFVPLTTAPTIAFLAGGGDYGSNRIKIEFPDNTIRNTWLRVTLLANAITGLGSNDTFYFGNSIAEMNVGNIGSPITLRVNATDTSIVRQNQSPLLNSVGISSIHDVNKDGRVNATDTSIVRQNQLPAVLRFFDAPPSPPSLAAMIEEKRKRSRSGLSDFAIQDLAISQMFNGFGDSQSRPTAP